jgi:20S proteasome alpha/beta subunit
MISLTRPKPIGLDRHKKPQYPSPSKPAQAKQVKAMTIAAGFQCRDGVVLCADRQMSHGTANDFGSFAHFEKKVHALQALTVGATLCGSGNDGTLIRPIADAFFKKVESYEQPVELSDLLEDTLNEFATKLGRIPEVSLLAAAVVDGESAFVRSEGLVVHTAGPDPEIMGIGELSVVRYLTDSVFKHDLGLPYVAALAVLVVYVAKKYCPQYCSGQTDVFVLPNDYFWDTVPISEEKINEAEKVLAVSAQAYLPKALYQAATLLSLPT